MSDHLISGEAEQAVISSVLVAPQVWDDVSFLTEDDFAIANHKNIWATFRRGEGFRDLVTLITTTKDIEFRVCIGELARGTFYAGNVKFYAQIVRERASLRKLSAACLGILARLDGSTQAADAISSAIRDIEAIGDSAVIGKGPRHISEVGGEWYEAFRERATSDGRMVGMPTGFAALDERWGGMRGGQMIVVAGRPKRGKSTFAANIAQHVAKNTPALVFNMEMGALEMVDRAVSAEGRIDVGQIRNGTLSRDGWDGMLAAWHGVSGSKLYIDDTPSQTIDSIRLQAKAFVKRHGQSLIVIDYLQLIRGDQRHSAYERVSEISRGIKLLAKETDCPVIALVQMNRAIEGAARKPNLSDLRDSGAIEQDADIVAFCHQDTDEQDYTELITRAMRSGQPGTDYLMRRFSVSRFETAESGFAPVQPVAPQSGGKRRKAFNAEEC